MEHSLKSKDVSTANSYTPINEPVNENLPQKTLKKMKTKFLTLKDGIEL